MVDLALITAETIMVKRGGQDVPCVVLIGRDPDGSKKMFRTKFDPYCYINEEDYTEVKGDYLNFESYCKAGPTFVRGLNKKALTKLEFPTSKF